MYSTNFLHSIMHFYDKSADISQMLEDQNHKCRLTDINNKVYLPPASAQLSLNTQYFYPPVPLCELSNFTIYLNTSYR